MSTNSITSRQRVRLAIEHQETDRVPLDLAGTTVTGMHVTTVYRLRQALGLDGPGTPVRVIEPMQMLGEIEPDLMYAMGVDTVALAGTFNIFGFKNDGWKPWDGFHDTPVLVPREFNTEPEPNGDLFAYPQGDRSAAPAGRMPRGSFYFDTNVRAPLEDDENPDLEDNLEEFGHLPQGELDHLREESERLYTQTDKAIVLSLGGMSFGDVAGVPGPMLRAPRGIRDVEEWYVSIASRPDYVRAVFERQCEIGLANLNSVHRAVGDRVTAVFLCGTDFGTQRGPLISPRTYRDLFWPFHKRVNDWVHAHTNWKIFIHSCGSVRALYEGFIEAGFDIINPVQCSAAHMASEELKAGYGDRVSFWGGGVDTQATLPFGTPEQVRDEVRERIRIFGRSGGYVFNTVHNVQARVPVENLIAVYETVRDYG